NAQTEAWADTSDSVQSAGILNQYSAYYQPWTPVYGAADYVPLDATGQRLRDPAGTATPARLSYHRLWGAGPQREHVRQGQTSDCYFLAPIAALAYARPDLLKQMAVDLEDNTYAIRMKKNGVTNYVRIDDDWGGSGYYAGGTMYAHPTND